MRHGLVEKAVNNTLDIYDRYFNDLEIEEKLRGLEKCLVWSTIAYLSSKSSRLTLRMLQSTLKMLPCLTFAEFTTDFSSDNHFSAPARFTTNAAIEPILNSKIIADILAFITDVIVK